MATYNGGKYIEEQLSSILNQKRQADEVIICDDNSSDDTAKIITQFIQDNNLQEKWRLIVNKENKGYPQNFFYCIENCSGEVLFFSDQDDIWEKDKIKKMVAVLNENPKIQVLSCNHGVIDSKGNIINGFMTPKTSETENIKLIDIHSIIRAYHWPGMTMAIRKDYLNDVYDNFKDLNIAHDLLLAIFASDIQGFYYYDYIGAYHRRHSNNNAKEEHRIYKLLNLSRKLSEVEVYNEMLKMIIDAEFPLSTQVEKAIKNKFELSKIREEVLKNRNFKRLFLLYLKNRNILSIKPFISDLWILCFGYYKKNNKE